MRIYYIGIYDFQDAKIPRRYTVSAVNKMTYIAQVLLGLYPETRVVSLALPVGKRFFYSHNNITKNGISTHFFPFFGFLRHERLIDMWRSMCLFLYGLFHFHKGDVIISYHTSSLASNVLVRLRKIKKVKIILEVEEIYSDLLKSANTVWKREQCAFENSDGYIFSTEMLAEKINKKQLPSVVIYGTYQSDTESRIKDDDLVHVVYAGTFDPRKGGAAAAAAAAYLPNNYHLHICGFGKQKEIDDIKSVINELREKGHNVSYEGLLKGQNYLDMLHKCQIGLSTQVPSAKFNNTSFPSKILSYMSAGLAVVSISIPAIEGSKVGKYITFYENQTPEEIARSIIKCDISQGERNKDVIASLDAGFKKELKSCIQEVLS